MIEDKTVIQRINRSQDLPLVSIIIPVYNVERYLPQCLDSVLAQSYENYEAILLDDGSTDSSGTICDEYALRDERIRALHTENGGLSRARNICIEHACGDLFLFLDSDDWIEPNTIQSMANALMKNDADIVCCQYSLDWQNYAVERKSCSETVCLEKDEILHGLLTNQTISVYAWGKLYKSSLFESIRFPEGHLFEDLCTTHLLCMNADRIVCIPDCFFHYRQSSGSITHSHTARTLIDHWHAQRKRYNDIMSVTNEYERALVQKCSDTILRTWCWWYSCPKKDRYRYSDDIFEMRDFIRKHANEVQHSNMIN